MILEIIVVSAIAFILNFPLGRWRSRYKRLSLPWWLLIHASIPVILSMRIWLDTPRFCIPLFIAVAILGQQTGVWSAKRKLDSCE